MARQRGGLAGIWDRNKGIIKTALPAALSFVPGVGIPLATAAGAAMEGLDRPGKSGIGLDVGGAIRGGISGYGIGRGTQSIAGGVKGLFAPKAPPEIAAPDLSKYTDKLTTQTGTANPIGSARIAQQSPVTAFDYSGYGVGVPPSSAVKPPLIPGLGTGTDSTTGMVSNIRGGFGRGETVFGPGAEPMAAPYTPPAQPTPAGTAGRIARRMVAEPPAMPSDIAAPDLSKYTGNLITQTATANPMGSAQPQFNMQNSILDLLRGEPTTTGPSRLQQLAEVVKQAGGTATPTPTPAGQPWYRSKEILGALGQGAMAGANIIGSQRQAALEQERMDREEREARARAELMALFAPRILASYQPYTGA